MTNTSKITPRALFQYLIIIVAVLIVGLIMSSKGEKQTSFNTSDSLVSATPISAPQEIVQNPEKVSQEINEEPNENSSGHKIVYGNAEAPNGKLYPFRVEFDEYDGKIGNAIYYNSAYSTKVNFNSAEIIEGEYVFSGNIGKEKLLLKFSVQHPYVGVLTQGNSSLKTVMNL